MSVPMEVDHQLCVNCGLCLPDCPKEAIARPFPASGSPGDAGAQPVKSENKPVILEGCVACQVCAKACPRNAIRPSGRTIPGLIVCDHCPVGCHIGPGQSGACRRYRNPGDGKPLKRTEPLQIFDPEKHKINPQTGLPYHPLLTGAGAGTNLQLEPARIIAEKTVEGVDVVTAVTEAVLSFSGLEVKIDTSDYIGPEGSAVKRDGKVVGYVGVSYYASRTLNIGGVTLLKGPDGFTVARTIADFTDGKEVELRIVGGATLRLTRGQVPIINGEPAETTTFGCGSSVGKGFSHVLLPIVDECVMLDMGITGQMSEHHAALGAKPCGITLIGKRSSPGRWMLPSGKGWGGTCVENPVEVIASIDKTKAWPGLRILVMETKAQRAAYFELDEAYRPVEKPLPPKVQETLEYMRTFCDPGNVNVMYVGGIGGGVRGALNSEQAPRVCQSIKEGKVLLTAGGQPTYIYPGGNLIFTADTAKMPAGSIRWEPTPATSVPIEFTMTRETYDYISDYPDAPRPLEQILKEINHVVIED